MVIPRNNRSPGHRSFSVTWVLVGGIAAGMVGQAPSAAPQPSVKSTHHQLGVTLRELTRQTSVGLSCDPDLAPRRVVLISTERPLEEIRARLARFLATPPGKCLWEYRRPSGRPQWHLVEDLASKNARAEPRRSSLVSALCDPCWQQVCLGIKYGLPRVCPPSNLSVCSTARHSTYRLGASTRPNRHYCGRRSGE
jgi:hypothetical protein